MAPDSSASQEDREIAAMSTPGNPALEALIQSAREMAKAVSQRRLDEALGDAAAEEPVVAAFGRAESAVVGQLGGTQEGFIGCDRKTFA